MLDVTTFQRNLRIKSIVSISSSVIPLIQNRLHTKASVLRKVFKNHDGRIKGGPSKT